MTDGHAESSIEAVYYIDVPIDDNANEAPCDCVLCGTELERAKMEYSYHASNPGTIRSKTKIPGYRCPKCDAPYVPAEAEIPLLRTILPLLADSPADYASVGDRMHRLERTVRRSIRSTQQR